MKRRSWLWFIVAAILAVAAGVLAIVILSREVEPTPPPSAAQPQRLVVVARNPIAADSIIRTDNVTLAERDDIPSGAAVARTSARRDDATSNAISVGCTSSAK